jgi:hypothetical protein
MFRNFQKIVSGDLEVELSDSPPPLPPSEEDSREYHTSNENSFFSFFTKAQKHRFQALELW